MDSSCITLAPGEFVADWSYSFCHFIDFIALLIHLRHVIDYRHPPPVARGYADPLCIFSMVVNALIMVLIILGFVVNEKHSNPSIMENYQRIQMTMLVLHLVLTLVILFMTTARSLFLVQEKAYKFTVFGINVAATAATAIILGFIIRIHQDYTYYLTVGDVGLMRDTKATLTLLTMIEIALFALFNIGNTVFIIYYIAMKLLERKGFMNYFKTSYTTIVGTTFACIQLALLISSALIYAEVIEPRSWFMHLMHLTYCNFIWFMYFSSTRDLKGGVRENNKAMLSGKYENSHAASAGSYKASARQGVNSLARPTKNSDF